MTSTSLNPVDETWKHLVEMLDLVDKLQPKNNDTVYNGQIIEKFDNLLGYMNQEFGKYPGTLDDVLANWKFGKVGILSKEILESMPLGVIPVIVVRCAFLHGHRSISLSRMTNWKNWINAYSNAFPWPC